MAMTQISPSPAACGKMGRKIPKVLFLSTGNATRSQIAEGFLRTFGGDHFDVMSAGIMPGPLNPLAVQVMQERGIDISAHEPTDVAHSLKEHFAYVITVCDAAKERSPIFPFTPRLLHWSIQDPAAAKGSAEEKMQIFRGVRDEIEGKIRQFIAETAGAIETQLTLP